MTGLFLVGMLFVCLFLGVPIAVSLGFASIVTLLTFADQSMLSLAQKFFHTMQVYPLLAIPFFILAGTLMTSGGVAKRMIDFLIRWSDTCTAALRWHPFWPVCYLPQYRGPHQQRWWRLEVL